MPWVDVQAGQDHLLHYAKRSPIDALTELLWNSLDAEADHVDAYVSTESLVPGDLATLYVTGVEIRDDGHGMTQEVARQSFQSLGDSWKKNLNGRTANQHRILHGRHGRGRFFAYSIGSRVRWVSVAGVGLGFEEVIVEGAASAINRFNIQGPTQVAGPSGTVVTIDVEQGRQLGRLMAEDLHVQIAGRMAAHLLGAPDLEVIVNGARVDPEPLIDGEPHEVVLDDVGAEVLQRREAPVLLIVQWTDEMRDPLGLVLCSRDGASLMEVPGSAIASPIRATAYLKWSGFEESDLTMAEMGYPEVIDAARDKFQAYIRERAADLTASIVTTLKEEGAYPYPEEARGPIERAERDAYDLILVAARNVLGPSRQQRSMSARLLQLALQERPEDLDEILDQTLRLNTDQRSELAQMLRYSSLGRVIGAASEVGKRLELLMAMRHLLYDADSARRLREVDQLHPLVKENVWLFGEEWRLTASEAALAGILRRVIDETRREGDLLLEADMVREGSVLVSPERLRGRVDLLLQRTLDETDQRRRLVVELKRPSIAVGANEVEQVRGYARALSQHAGIGPGKWVFWLVGATIDPAFEPEMRQEGREYGNIMRGSYELWVGSWSHLIQRAERRLNFFRDQLGYTIAQDEAVRRVHERHQEILGRPSRRGPRVAQA